jgi:hypothetical protein
MRKGTGEMLFGLVILMGSISAAVRGTTWMMSVFNFTIAAVVLLDGFSRWLEIWLQERTSSASNRT